MVIHLCVVSVPRALSRPWDSDHIRRSSEVRCERLHVGGCCAWICERVGQTGLAGNDGVGGMPARLTLYGERRVLYLIFL